MHILMALFIWLFAGAAEEEHLYKQYIADGPSMAPTIEPDDRMLVDLEYYYDNPFERGDIIVFIAPNQNFYVKRVIGLPGETVRMSNNQLYINDELQEEPYIEDAVNQAGARGEKYNMDFDAVTVPENSVFVLGDNRRNSYDSIMMGPISYESVIGKVIEIKHE